MTDENTLIAFSGGRSSGLMLYKTLEAYDFSLPDNFAVCFANTGKELPQTLDFIQRCSDEWGVDIKWLEMWARPAKEEEKNKYKYEIKVVDHKTASRNGEPFINLIQLYGTLPNPVARWCSAHLKTKAIRVYLEEHLGWESPTQAFIGVRADEDRRARKLHNNRDEGQDRYCPLFLDGVTKHDVGHFWESQDFDLELPNNNGVTDWGNCDLCFLKAAQKKISIIRERPNLANWWEDVEKEMRDNPLIQGAGGVFRTDHPSYSQMKIIATDQQGFNFLEDDETIPCFCGD